MKPERRKTSIIVEVAVLFLIGVLLTGLLTYLFESRFYDSSVKKQMELYAAEIADETIQAVKEFPAYLWLMRYWHDHADSMEIEYDATLQRNALTAEKCRLFTERHPDLELRYIDGSQFNTLSEEDQKLYAEITYSWLLTRVNEIKKSYNVSYLFCVISEEPFDHQFFLFSAAQPGAVRGTGSDEAYPLGNVVSVNESQSEAMHEAVHKYSHLADAGEYVDFYTLMGYVDGRNVFIGLTYDLSDIRAEIRTQTFKGARVAIFNQFVLSLICLALIFVFVLYPLKKVQGYIRQYKETKESGPVVKGLSEVRARNEIGQLAEDVSEMAREIDSHVDKIRDITARSERINTELTLATRIQSSMLPSIFPPFPERQEFDIYASMDPAKEVGGDFYDFFLIDEDHLALVIADVSGKGVPAALFMMVSKILIKNYAMTGLSPAGVLDAVNRQICANNREDMFVTVWFGILEISSGKLTASNAGHEYPVLKKPDGPFELIKDKHGFVVGAMETVRYKEYEMMLLPGAKFFVYTDGVPEASNAENELFGTERMLAVLNEEPASAPPEETLRNVRQAVNDYVGDAEQFDDLTMLCVEYRGTCSQNG